MNKISLIYVAGPFTAETREGCKRNIETALQVGRFVAAKGYMPVVPHAITPMFDSDYPSLQNYEFWIEGTKELMRRCDAVVLCPGWETSKGTLGEIETAKQISLHIYNSVSDLPNEIK